MLKVRKALCGFLLAIVTLSGVSSPVAARELTTSEKQIVADVIKDRLRDPASAMFKWGPLQGETKQDGDNAATSIYCGYVNSKNAYGGYVGDTPFRVFLVLADEVVSFAAVIGMGSGKIDVGVTYDMCAEDGYDLRYFAGAH